MTKRKDTRPKPSQPSRIAIKFGIKIKKFIDTTNKITSQINRGIKGSLDIYLVEKFITQAEMRITREENISPVGSRIKLIMIEVELIERMVQSMIIVLFRKIKIKPALRVIGKSINRHSAASFVG